MSVAIAEEAHTTSARNTHDSAYREVALRWHAEALRSTPPV